MAIPLSDSASADNGVLRKDILGDGLGTGELWGHGTLERDQGLASSKATPTSPSPCVRGKVARAGGSGVDEKRHPMREEPPGQLPLYPSTRHHLS